MSEVQDGIYNSRSLCRHRESLQPIRDSNHHGFFLLGHVAITLLIPFLQSLDLKSHTILGRENFSEQTSEASRPQANAQDTDVRGPVQLTKDPASASGSEEDAGKAGSLAKGMWDGAFNKGGGPEGVDGIHNKISVDQVRSCREGQTRHQARF